MVPVSDNHLDNKGANSDSSPTNCNSPTTNGNKNNPKRNNCSGLGTSIGGNTTTITGNEDNFVIVDDVPHIAAKTFSASSDEIDGKNNDKDVEDATHHPTRTSSSSGTSLQSRFSRRLTSLFRGAKEGGQQNGGENTKQITISWMVLQMFGWCLVVMPLAVLELGEFVEQVQETNFEELGEQVEDKREVSTYSDAGTALQINGEQSALTIGTEIVTGLARNCTCAYVLTNFMGSEFIRIVIVLVFFVEILDVVYFFHVQSFPVFMRPVIYTLRYCGIPLFFPLFSKGVRARVNHKCLFFFQIFGFFSAMFMQSMGVFVSSTFDNVKAGIVLCLIVLGVIWTIGAPCRYKVRPFIQEFRRSRRSSDSNNSKRTSIRKKIQKCDSMDVIDAAYMPPLLMWFNLGSAVVLNVLFPSVIGRIKFSGLMRVAAWYLFSGTMKYIEMEFATRMTHNKNIAVGNVFHMQLLEDLVGNLLMLVGIKPFSLEFFEVLIIILSYEFYRDTYEWQHLQKLYEFLARRYSSNIGQKQTQENANPRSEVELKSTSIGSTGNVTATTASSLSRIASNPKRSSVSKTITGGETSRLNFYSIEFLFAAQNIMTEVVASFAILMVMVFEIIFSNALGYSNFKYRNGCTLLLLLLLLLHI